MKLNKDTAEALIAIHRNGDISRKKLAELLNISITKAATIIMELEKQHCLSPIEGKSSGGRVPQLYRIENTCGHVLGIDIGTEYVRMGITDPSGILKATSRTAFNIDAIRSLPSQRFAHEIQHLCQDSQIEMNQIAAVGIGLTGIIHEGKGTCLSLRNTPSWKGLHIVREFRSITGIETIIITDSVKAMALSEQIHGKAGGLDDFILLNIGIGLGAGIVIGGRLLDGNRGTTGEIGHMHIRPSQTLCVCGNYGCLESIASGWAILRKCKNAIKEGVETNIGKDKELSQISVRDIIEAADAHDKIALTLLDSMAKDLSVGIGSVINLLNPEKIFLSGGLIQHAKDHMFDPLMRGVKSTVIPWLQNTIDIEISEQDEFSVVRGAAAMAFEKAIENKNT